MNKLAMAFLLALLVGVIVGVILSLPIMLLWNYCLVPAVPMLVEITWLQSCGIYILFNILFKPSGVSKHLELS